MIPKTEPITHFENESESEDVQNYWRLDLWTKSTKMSEYMREKNIVGKRKGRKIIIRIFEVDRTTQRKGKRKKERGLRTLQARN